MCLGSALLSSSLSQHAGTVPLFSKPYHMAPFSLKAAALAALSFCSLSARGSPLPPGEVALNKKQSTGYKNIVYFTNW